MNRLTLQLKTGTTELGLFDRGQPLLSQLLLSVVRGYTVEANTWRGLMGSSGLYANYFMLLTVYLCAWKRQKLQTAFSCMHIPNYTYAEHVNLVNKQFVISVLLNELLCS